MHEYYIGLMSGTSMDGIDAVLVDLNNGMRLCGTHSEPLNDALKAELLAISQPGDQEIDRMGELDIQLGQLFAKAALALLAHAELPPHEVRAIGSHGQTIRHRPNSPHPFTLQIGDPNSIAEVTGITVVADLRRRDMAAGGQGAPLVPAFHQAAFQSPDIDRVVLNLGGMANITVLPAGQAEGVYGFDTGPANVLMDAWCQRIKNQAYDRDGLWAANGSVVDGLLERLLGHPFFMRRPPKSTGREDFHLGWLLGELGSEENDPADIQATLLELTAQSVIQAIAHEGLRGGELLLCGGGALNPTLVTRLTELLPDFRLRSSAEFGLAPTWVEACAFAWLARQCLHGQPGNLAAVTGARGPRILGGIYPGHGRPW